MQTHLRQRMTDYWQESLTKIEAEGLKSHIDLGNGHASHELSKNQSKIIEKLPDLWRFSQQLKSFEAEYIFKDKFQQLSRSPSIKNYHFFKICPTASNSIDLIAAWLSNNRLKVGLIEPTFDNLYLILKRRGVLIKPILENILHNEDYWKMDSKDLDAIFLVNPNNPTGRILSYDLIKDIIEWCVKYNKVLIIDHSFRFFIPQLFDIYQMLIDANLTFISIEDTGKVWPTQEIKASLLVTSKNIFNQICLIYDEIFLCHSNLALVLLADFFQDAIDYGLCKTVWRKVKERRLLFRNIIQNSMLSIDNTSLTSTISVEWVKISRGYATDRDMLRYFENHNFVFLPGTQFYWSNSLTRSSQYLRFALLKTENNFMYAMKILEKELNKLKKCKNIFSINNYSQGFQ